LERVLVGDFDFPGSVQFEGTLALDIRNSGQSNNSRFIIGFAGGKVNALLSEVQLQSADPCIDPEGKLTSEQYQEQNMMIVLVHGAKGCERRKRISPLLPLLLTSTHYF
jgi:hypothetical protein